MELTADLQAVVEQATIAVARFDATVAHRLIPFTPLLLRTESVASSKIERLTSSARKVLEAELTGSKHGNAGLIASNVQQMEVAKELTVEKANDLLELHRILLEHSAPAIAGVLRNEPVWIGGADQYPLDAYFVAPHQRLLPDALDDFLAFLARVDLPALAHAAVAHAHFESIHPFADGNGRTGRALIHIVLRQRGLTTETSLPISASLLADVDSYFEALDAYRDGDIASIVRLFAQAAIEATRRGEWLVAQLDSVREEWEGLVTARKDAADWKALGVLIRQPLVTVAGLTAELGITPAAARATLVRLEGNGILIGAQMSNKVRAWRAPDVLDLLDEFGDGMRRGTASV
ncbi:Fic family protein [Corynebacterium meitnerae]|uniref:Fic family protein n=1 Tax=Corynebacterium meitnerae TaxID=2913498 RepID=A0A9X3RKV8_9CORY|nr:Fic family protein [Corynebacterium meitnerae]MCZ9294516.1 Fic family protein [Corynebacterium meitnerae]